VVEGWKSQSFEEEQHISTLRTRTELIFKTLVFFTIEPLDPADSLRALL
jgi:hypothetical protein